MEKARAQKVRAGLRRAVLAAAALLPAMTGAHADKTLTGHGEFYADAHHSLNDCREGALQRARLDALAREYGLTVAEDVWELNRQGDAGGADGTFFQALNTTEVRGEWVADTAEPRYEISHDSDGLYIVRCTVTGTTRPLSNQAPDFKALVLRNGTDDRCADTRFRSGDCLAVSLRTPCDGYAAAYLACQDGRVYTLLPYTSSLEGTARVKGGEDYVLFSEECTRLGEPDCLELRTDLPVERNYLYVFFSPNQFTKAVDSRSEAEGTPRSLSQADFSKWVARTRSHDPRMAMKMTALSIEGDGR